MNTPCRFCFVDGDYVDPCTACFGRIDREYREEIATGQTAHAKAVRRWIGRKAVKALAPISLGDLRLA